jgi:tetratricopeptide (TPR) repeat protein
MAWSLIVSVTLHALWKPWPDTAILGWLWFLLSLLPVTGLVSNGANEIADRFLYIPILGLALVVGSGLERMAGHGGAWAKTAPVAATALVAAMIVLTSVRLPQWKDSLSLFPSILARSPGNAVAWNALGRARELQGHTTAALEDYERALAVNPLFWQAAMNRANILVAFGRHGESIAQLQGSVRQFPDNARLKSNLGAGLFASGQQAEGILLMRQALEIDPYLLDTRYNLALALKLTGDPVAARQTLEALLHLNPTDEAARSLLATLENP